MNVFALLVHWQDKLDYLSFLVEEKEQDLLVAACRATVVYLLFAKTEIKLCTALPQFMFYAKTQFHNIVQIVDDNPKELCEGAMLDAYRNNGIELQRSCVDTSQQSQKVVVRHLLKVTRSYFQSI